MTNRQFKFGYRWEEIRPIRPLYLTTVAAQIIGASVSLETYGSGSFLEAVWLGGAIATLPGFLAGVPVQLYLRPGSLSEHRQMVMFLGFIAAILTVVAIFFPPVTLKAA